ncbi:hypothetical protein SEA_SURVIVORS_52 [Gordonia phage Survivors]|nr:hypothetical protein SEA_SURVIVORS_52 [Gordonia phage Survivors]
MTYPQTLQELIRIPEYRAFYAKPPTLLPSTSPTPWAVVGIAYDGRYGKVQREDFKSAFATAKKLFHREEIRDICVFPKNTLTPVPDIALTLVEPGFDWCGRCRRPSIFQRYPTTHPALKDAPVVEENQVRCYFCGIRQSYMMGSNAA